MIELNLNLNALTSCNEFEFDFCKVNKFEFEFSFCKVNENEFELSFFKVNEFEFEFKFSFF